MNTMYIIRVFYSNLWAILELRSKPLTFKENNAHLLRCKFLRWFSCNHPIIMAVIMLQATHTLKRISHITGIPYRGWKVVFVFVSHARVEKLYLFLFLMRAWETHHAVYIFHEVISCDFIWINIIFVTIKFMRMVCC